MSAAPNRLAKEASPYLQQHAQNPVDWYPWGEEALERAKREGKPILLSIGYAACHWCHVMERESFENEEIAALMNDLYVNIKVDREERPDLDQIYQLVVQLMGRSGGWPLTVFLTPEQRPFFAGTYFPPKDKMGMPGFPKVLGAVFDAYQNRRGEVETQAQEIVQEIGRIGRIPRAQGEPNHEFLAGAAKKLLLRVDEQHGGFGTRPKFPNTMNLDVLLRRSVQDGDALAKRAFRSALDNMRKGGIWDHLRGGFHRYSTDQKWLVPHFEKMLYDNALLLTLYVDGYRAFGDALYADTAREIVGYLLAEMVTPSGAFYASQDADSEGEEGKFFVFTLEDLEQALGAHDAPSEAPRDKVFHAARLYYGITEHGNFEHSGATVLAENKPILRVATEMDTSEEEVLSLLAIAKPKMLAYREKRPRPFRDDKVLASWNALMISALADAGCALSEPSWVEVAKAAFDRIEQKLIKNGRVGRFLMGDVVKGEVGFLDDQSYIANAALDLFEATQNPHYEGVARSIADQMIEHHWDVAEGGFYFTPTDGEKLITRTKDAFDQATPSGLSLAAQVCVRLGERGGDKYKEIGETQVERLAAAALDNPFGFGKLICLVDRLVRGTVDVVVVGEQGASGAKALLDVAFAAYLPNRNIVFVDPAKPETVKAAGALGEGKPLGKAGESVAYVCRGRACSAPVTTPHELKALLQ